VITESATVIFVGAGKGGVGKSTVALNLAVLFAEQGHRVGLFDADVSGPNIPLMSGLTRYKPRKQWTMARSAELHPDVPKPKPVQRHGIEMVSAGFVFGEQQAIAFDATTVGWFLTQLLRSVDWSDPDVLVVDLPPGSGTVVQTLMGQLPMASAVVVVTPQRVAHLDALRAVETFRRRNIRVLGAIENMAGLTCPHCGEKVELFPHVVPARSIWQVADTPHLGDIPLDPAAASAAEGGEPVVLAYPDAPSAQAYRRLFTTVSAQLRNEGAA